MKTVRFVPPRVPLVDLRTGTITREWYLLLEQLFSWQVSSAETDTALSGISPQAATEIQLFDAMQELRQTQIAVMPLDNVFEPPRPEFIALDDIAPVLGLLRDEIAELRKAIEGLGIAP